jgi:hypothetical protein
MIAQHGLRAGSRPVPKEKNLSVLTGLFVLLLPNTSLQSVVFRELEKPDQPADKTRYGLHNSQKGT